MLTSQRVNHIAENIPGQVSVTTGTRPGAMGQNGDSTQLHGRRLVLARCLAGILAGLAIGFFIIALPARLAELGQLTLETGQAISQLAPVERRLLLGLIPWLKHYPIYALVFEAGLMLLFLFSTAVLWWRKSNDWLALFLIVTQLTYGLYVIPPLDALLAAQPAWQLAGNIMQALGLGCALLFFYIFPDGRFTPHWTRNLMLVWLGWVLLWLIFPTSPFNLADPYSLSFGWFLVFMLWWFSGLYAQVYRYRSVSNPVQRQQTKFILLGVSFAILGYGLYLPARFILPLITPSGPLLLLYQLLGIQGFLACVFVVPLSLTFSILRYRLWDIDLIINRTLVYAVLTVILACFYAASIMSLQHLILALVGQTSPLAIAASTLALAALFNPLRGWVQAGIDRRFYRRKYDTAQALADFSATLHDEVDLPRLIERLETVIWENIRPVYIITWLRTPSGFSVHQRDTAELVRHRPQMHLAGFEISGQDPLVHYFHHAGGVVEIDRLDLTSPASQRLKSGEVKLVVPLISQGALLGWLSLGARLSEQGYSADDKILLTHLADQVAPAVRVAQLVRQQQAEAREHERLEQELGIARLVQQTLLPQAVPSLPGWDMATYWQPARAVGGDFYDFLPLPDGRWVLVIGDVADKGIPAALVMATTRTILRDAVRRVMSPGAALARANDLLYPETPPQMFVTCLYAILEPSSGRMRYANAGHNLPYRYGTGRVTELKATGMPLGLLPDRYYDEYETIIRPGECLLMYSDGLVEAHNSQGEIFGFPRLEAWLSNHADTGSRLIDGLLADLAGFTGPDWEQEDDVTFVTLERTASPARESNSPSGDDNKR